MTNASLHPRGNDSAKYYSRYYTYINPLLKSPTVKLYGTYTLTIFAVTVFIIFAIKPTLETITVLQTKLENSKTVLERITQKSENLSLAKKNYEALGPETKQKINNLVPNKVFIQSVIQSLEQAAKTNQASISALQFQPITITNKDETLTNSTLATVDFTFNVEGSYSTLLKVITSIQNSSRLISIENLIFNKSADASIIVMSASGKAYYLK